MDALAETDYLVNIERFATPKDRLLTFRVGAIDAAVLAEAKRLRFDDAPVINDQDQFVGIISVAHVERLIEAEGEIHTDDPAITKHTLKNREPLLKFLDEIATHRAAVIRDTDDKHDSDWLAMVTVSDLNRHAFRAYIYPLLAELESNLADLIDASFPNLGDWLPRVPDGRRTEIAGLWEEAKLNNVDTSPAVYCNLMDFVNIVAKHSSLWGPLGYESRRAWETATGFLGILRNQVMHPVRPLILNSEDAHLLRERVEALLDLNETVKKENERLTRNGAVMKRYMP